MGNEWGVQEEPYRSHSGKEATTVLLRKWDCPENGNVLVFFRYTDEWRRLEMPRYLPGESPQVQGMEAPRLPSVNSRTLATLVDSPEVQEVRPEYLPGLVPVLQFCSILVREDYGD